MNGAIMLAMLVIVPFTVALVATRLKRSRSFVIWSAVVAQLITMGLTRIWSRYATERAFARAIAEHRDFAVMRFPPDFQRELVVCIVLSALAAGIAAMVFAVTRSARGSNA